MLTPKVLLRFEGLIVLVFSCWAYARRDGDWLWFALLFLTPDLFMLGYLFNRRAGAALYNVAHTYTLPGLWFGYLWISGASAPWLLVPFIWTAHIGVDRFLGFGLKHRSGFKHTHLQTA
jgi:hypothetical protein